MTQLLKTVSAILHRLLPGISGNHKNSSDSKRSDSGSSSSSSNNTNNGGSRGDKEEKDPFKVLGLEGGKENTTIEEATKARRKLAMTWHPDRNIDNAEEATKKMQEINDAFHRVEKILERSGEDGEEEESDDESVESEGATRRSRQKWRKQQYDEAREAERKFKEEFSHFEKAQRNAARGNFTSASYAAESAATSQHNNGERGMSKRAKKRAARKRAKENKAQCGHVEGSNRSDGSKAADENNIPFHHLPLEKRCEVKFQSKDLVKTPTFTGEFLAPCCG